MQITSLEIKGFKSFGEKVVINFDKGITGIVGPNGCGKSNVIDAIRWVLGEQKLKVLRSEKMDNIIFNGTKNRKAHHLAEVTLTLSNTKNILPTEYNNISISRRFYRGGASEYLLNDTSCRLKDITTLFMDTGIATNSYAIIELKMVDEILNDNNNSRRMLFEEAAGNTKFKKRKNESLNKLEGTDDDLNRVDDLLFEIEKNLKSIEKQAGQAERYNKIKNDYKKYSVVYGKKVTTEKTNPKNKIDNEIQSLQSKKTNYIAKITSLETKNESNKKTLVEIENILKTKQQELNKHINDIRQVESDKKVKNANLKMLSDKVEKLVEEIKNDKQSQERAELSIKSLGLDIKNAENNYKTLIEECAEFEKQKKHKHEEYQKIANKLNAKNDDLNNTIADKHEIDKALEVKKMQIKTYQNELNSFSQDATIKVSNLKEFKSKKKEIEIEIENQKNSLNKIVDEEKAQLKHIENLEAIVDKLSNQLNKCTNEINTKQNQYDLTSSMINDLEGYPNAIKFLAKKTRWGKRKVLLSDILTCQEKYRAIIENYLKSYLNYYVVDTFEEAMSAIDILNDASKGKANFFYLEQFQSIKVYPVSVPFHAIPATEIIEFEDKYSKLISWLLNNVFIVNNIPENSLGNQGLVLITEDGKVIKNKYSINGGSIDLFQGTRLGRVKNLENLDIELKKLKKQENKIKESYTENNNEIDKIKQIKYRFRIEEKNKTISTLQKDYATFKIKYEQLSELLNTQKNKRKNLNANIETLENEVIELEKKQSEVNAALESKKSIITEVENKIKKANEDYQAVLNVYNEYNIIKIQNENNVKQLKSELTHKKNLLENAIQKLIKNKSEEKITNEQIKQLLETTETNENKLLYMYNIKENMSKNVEIQEKEYYEVKQKIDGNEADIKTNNEKKSTLEEEIIEKKESKNSIEMKIMAIKERLSVEFGISLADDEIDDKKVNELSVYELQQKIEDCNKKIARIGVVNPMAQETYQEIKERYAFVTSQKEDLLKSKETLLKTINEIESYAQETFLDTFSKIKENFTVVFRSLFTDDDDCDIFLRDPQNPLSSPIEIIAKPKGKKPLSINQLSGGEKSLTAISLLFSLYLLKPAPFCIFDEVDAPLDDANIDKFNKIISKFSNDSQFIIVTHNKRTMTKTDVIYGVTMVEQGISKVVPVDFSDLE